MTVHTPIILGSRVTTSGSDSGDSLGDESDANSIAWGIVGHEDPNPNYVRIENGQPWAEVTLIPEGDEIVARVGMQGAGAESGWYVPLDFGCRVAVEFVDGDPNDAVIVARMWDRKCAMPSSVAGVQTGAAGMVGPVTGPAPSWQFIRTPDGQMLGIETGSNGDVVIHSAASVSVKCGATGAIHMDGAVHMGSGPTTPPQGAKVGPGGEQIPGVPAVAHVPVPFTPGPPPTPTYMPFVGSADAVIRAKDMAQFAANTDPVGYTQFAAVYAHPLIGLPPPLVLVSQMRNQGTGIASKHTASD